MSTIHTIVLVVHVLIGALIIGLVLLQRGKGAEAGAAFGAGASGTVFGARGSANFLSRSTAVLATLFFVTSLSLAYLGSQREVPKSVLDAGTASGTAPPPKAESPQVPAGVPVDGAGTGTGLPKIGDQVPGPASPASGPGSQAPQVPGPTK